MSSRTQSAAVVKLKALLRKGPAQKDLQDLDHFITLLEENKAVYLIDTLDIVALLAVVDDPPSIQPSNIPLNPL